MPHAQNIWNLMALELKVLESMVSRVTGSMALAGAKGSKSAT